MSGRARGTRVGTRLSGGFLVLIVLFGGLLLFYHRVLQRSVTAGRDLAAVDSRALLGASHLLDLLDQMEEDASKYRITLDQGYVESYRAARTAVADTLAVLDGLALENGQREAVDRAVDTWRAFVAEHVVGRSPAEETRFIATAGGLEWAEFIAPLESLRQRTRSIRLASDAAVSGKIRQVSREADRAARTGWIAIAVALILGGGIAVSIVGSITGPLTQIEAGAGAIARGDFAARVDVRGGAELSSLGASFNEMAARLGELDLAKRNFLARMSHDLKTPLASVQETHRVLLDRIPGELNEKQARLLELALANAERLAAMISRLLELSRLQAGVEEYDEEPLDLVELSRSTIERLTSAWEADGHIDVDLSATVGAATVVGDRGALERVLQNLLDNARGHAGGGPIEVGVDVEPTADGGRALLRVRDHGPGIPLEDRSRIFESFSRRDGPHAHGHAGLGLAICREIVAAHGGEIRVTDAEGGGSEFVCALPVMNGEEPFTNGEEGGGMAESEGAAVRAGAIALIVSASLLGACASGSGPDVARPFDVHYGAGEWAAAVSAFEADSSLRADDWALYRAALIYARPDGDLYDGEAAVRLLDVLLERHPASPYATTARVVRQLVAETGRAEESAEETGADLHDPDEVLYRMGLAYADPDSDLFDPAEGTSVLTQLVERHPESGYVAPARVVLGLLAELGRSARAEAALRQQLDQLKEIDLKKPTTVPPPPPFAPPDRD